MHTSETNLNSLRKKMKDNDISFYIIPTSDPHLGENISGHWRIISWLTGFTGSAGFAIVTEVIAGLWTDSRYYLQAAKELSESGFSLLNPAEWNDVVSCIAGIVQNGDKIAMDGRLFSVDFIRRLERSVSDKNVSLNFHADLISDLWISRPVLADSVSFEHNIQYCGKDRSSKISEIRNRMSEKNLDYLLITSPDEIMWMLNIRGHDVEYSPLIMSFALVDREQILLFLNESSIPLKLAAEFDREGIVMLPYEEVAGMITTIPKGSAILLNPLSTSINIYKSIPAGISIMEDVTPAARLKAIKNITEQENIRNSMIKDGVSLSKFFFWLSENKTGGLLSEFTLAEKLDELRSVHETFLSPGFKSIVAFNANGALPHYTAKRGEDAMISGDGILLVDSGGQYLDGTTDITRTVAIGQPDNQQRKDFTLVLKGHLNLATAKFPEGTKGSQLDSLARIPLWNNGLNFGHGTGHGVGFCLNVHEGPQSVSQGTGSNTIIEPGMLISNEPAVYREGRYGIRIENLVLCQQDEETVFGNFLKFETVSLCYIDKALIDISLLDKNEIDWLNLYHKNVYNKLSPFLTADERKWLKAKTDAL